MFTGIVEELGTIAYIQQAANSLAVTIQADTIMTDLAIGDSIAVNGVCLTVADFTQQTFRVDVMPETFDATSLSKLQARAPVNLERSMPANGRFGGHFVTGHIDGTGQILDKTAQANAIVIDVSVPNDLGEYLIMKGSVAVDGVSLTVFDHQRDTLTVSIIPHTAKQTVLGSKTVGAPVNLEMDMLAKYVHAFMQQTHEASTTPYGLTETFLQDNGFV